MHSPAPSQKPFLSVLEGTTIRPAPLWLMRQAGRYLPEYRKLRAQAADFLDFCFTPELAIEATLQPIRRYGLDAAILFSDILTVPWGLGQRVEFLEGEGPRLQPLRSASDLDNLRISGLTERLAPVYKTVAGVAGALPPATALIGFAGAPWTVGSYMVEGGGSKDFLVARTFAHAEPLVFRRLIAILVDATIDHLSAQIAAGAETVQLFDSWAGALSEDQFRKWVIAPTRAIVATLKARYPKVPVIGFPRGAGAMLTAYAHETGVSAVGLDTQMPVGWAVDNLSTGFPIQGNLDPAALVVGGQALEDGVTHILQQAGARPLIFNLGHGVPMNTPPDHVARLVELVRA